MTIPQTSKPWAYLKFYGSDFLNSTASWTMEERGIYVTLLWYAWVNDGLPNDLDRLDRMAPGAKRAWDLLEDKLPVFGDGRRRNPRMEKDRDPFNERSKNLSSRGAKAAYARWHASGDASGMQQASDKQCMTHHSQSQSQSQNENIHVIEPCYDQPAEDTTDGADNETEARPPRGGKGRAASGLTGSNDAEASAVYAAYPRRVGRGAAIREIQRALDRLGGLLQVDRPTAARSMIEAVQDYARSVKGTDPKYIAHPRTWFSQGRWEDFFDRQAKTEPAKRKISEVYIVEYMRPPTDPRAKPTMAAARFHDREQASAFADRFGGTMRTL